MWFTYKPDGGEEQSWWFDPNKVDSTDAEAIERKTGWDWAEFGQHLLKAGVTARKALLWVHLRKTHPGIKYEAITFTLDEIELEYSTEELERLRDAYLDMDESESRTAAVALLEKQIADARPSPGKAHSSRSGSDTPTRSPNSAAPHLSQGSARSKNSTS